MVTCRPDIAFAVMKLLQFNNCPSSTHFLATKEIYCYLFATCDEGLTYWRPTKNRNLPTSMLPQSLQESYKLVLPQEFHTTGLAFCYADSDWAGCSRRGVHLLSDGDRCRLVWWRQSGDSSQLGHLLGCGCWRLLDGAPGCELPEVCRLFDFG